MNYLAQSKLTEDSYLIDRVAACAATKGIQDARLWAVNRIWALSAQPGWSAAYNKALTGEIITDPAAWAGVAGADPGVITDEMILAGVAAVLTENEAQAEAEASDVADEIAQLRSEQQEHQVQIRALTEQINNPAE